ARAIDRFWRQVLVSAVNEELDRMAASHGFQVFRLGFLARSDSYEMGVPAVPLGRLYRSEAWRSVGNVEIVSRMVVDKLRTEKGVVRGAGEWEADFYISAVP